MIYQLNQLASFHSGIYAKAQPMADTLYLQVSDFDSSGRFKKLATPMLNDSSFKPVNLLQKNDILFAAKGANNFATVYNGDFSKAVASSSFIVIRPNKEQANGISPFFLAWQLNHPAVLDPLKKSAVGSAMPAITMQQLSTVMIHVPPLKKQELIVRLYELHQQEKSLQQRLAQLKETYLHQLLFNAINPKTNG